jgi:hypothetical protein
MTAQHGIFWPLVVGLTRQTVPPANPAPITAPASTTATPTDTIAKSGR